MNGNWTIDVVWWIGVVELPVLAGLFWLIWRARQDALDGVEDNRRHMEHGLTQAREALSAYKLEVAKSYASIALLKEVEARLTRHLLRIEQKLDVVGGLRHDIDD
ncbi:MAG: hypothetical protein A2516_11100 [Alphaproteobacteria bacterium RIFOXYD12_FULL_60_8]|nr:MAG: hypothetical protein A2516_11100 [Alphaproteobacteria bacterium RIFOXYD12_FULL_60_8]